MDNDATSEPPLRFQTTSTTSISAKPVQPLLLAFLEEFKTRNAMNPTGPSVTVQLEKLTTALKQDRKCESTIPSALCLAHSRTDMAHKP
jgi:hypothetical protein